MGTTMKRQAYNPTPTEFCAKHHACDEGAEFAKQFKTMAEVWDNCKRPDWMLWTLDRLKMPLDKDRRLFACWCAVCTPMANGRTTRSLLTDPRSLEAVRVATRHALGLATDEQLAAAWASAGAAAGAAARSAARAAAWASAWASAGAAAWAAQAHHLRVLVPNPFR